MKTVQTGVQKDGIMQQTTFPIFFLYNPIFVNIPT